eukprot:scaffold15207_cov38-Prasinocladus_malaysianus.AAC.1
MASNELNVANSSQSGKDPEFAEIRDNVTSKPQSSKAQAVNAEGENADKLKQRLHALGTIAARPSCARVMHN